LTTLNATNLSSGTLPNARKAAGSVVQVVRASTDTMTQFTSVAAGARTGNVPGLTVTITPQFSNSLIYLFFRIPTSRGGGAHFYRGATEIQSPAAAGSRHVGYQRNGADAIFLGDAPATTSATTYNVRLSHLDSDTPRNIRVNGSRDDDENSFGTIRSRSFVEAWEVRV
jgi:hypothetical protein